MCGRKPSVETAPSAGSAQLGSAPMVDLSDLGRSAAGQNTSPAVRQLAADLNHLGAQVTPENVLGVRNVLLGEWTRLTEGMVRYGFAIHIGLCGKDPVSPTAQTAFNRAIDAHRDHAFQYVGALRAAAEALGETARAYGHAENEIARSFNTYLAEKRPLWDRQHAAHEDRGFIGPVADRKPAR